MPVAESTGEVGAPVNTTRSTVAPETHRIFRVESNRVLTFRQWPENITHISGQRLARAGFYYSGENTTVQCFECGGRISDWKRGDVAHTKHRILFPNCKFVLGVSDNIPLVNSTRNGTGNTSNNSNTQSLYTSSEDSGNSSDGSPPLSSSPTLTVMTSTSSGVSSSSPQSSSDSEDENVRNSWNRVSNISAFRLSMRSETNRLRTFYINEQSLWNVPGVRPEDLARAGFFYMHDDKVQCAFCTGILSNWSPGLRPLEEHSRNFPLCPFVMEEDVGNVPIGLDPIRDPLPVVGHDVCGLGRAATPVEQLGGQGILNTCSRNTDRITGEQQAIDIRQLGIQLYSGPKTPSMGPLENRRQSFVNSGWDCSIPISTDKLAEAGFYYIGYADAVKCFHCDGGLTEWAPDDDPWIEHAKKFPNCNFLKLNKNQLFIDECRRSERTSDEHNTNDDIPSTRSYDDITVCRIVDQWIANEEVVKQMISMNLFSIDLIKASLNSRYYTHRRPFDSFAQMYEAINELNDRQQNSRQSDNQLNVRQRDNINTNTNQLNINQTISTQQSNSEQLNINPNPTQSSTSTTTPLSTTVTVPQQQNTSSTAVSEDETNVNHIKNGNKNKTINDKNQANGSENRLVCKICYLSEIEVVFLPCGHQLACSECAQRLTDCPVCRQPIRGYVRTFFS